MRISDKQVTRASAALICLGLISACLSMIPSARFRLFDLGSDFLAYHLAARQWIDGASIYLLDPAATLSSRNIFQVTTRFLYPPVALVPLFPFGVLPYMAGFILWSAVGIALWIWLLRYWSSELGLQTVPAVRRLLLPTGLVCYPFVHHLGVGQLEVVLLALMTLGLKAFDQAPIKAGLCFGTAAVLKIYPVVLLVYLLLHAPTRAWRVCAAAVAVIAAASFLMLIGCRDSTLAEFADVLRFKEQYGNPYIINQSLVAFLQRSGLFDEGLARFQTFKLVLMGVVVAASLAALRSGSTVGTTDGLIRPYALFALSYPLYASYFWIQQFVLLLPVLLFVTAKAGERSRLFRCGVLSVWLVWYSGMFKVPAFGSPYSLALPAVLFFNRYLIAHLLLGLLFSTVALRQVQTSPDRDPLEWRPSH